MEGAASVSKIFTNEHVTEKRCIFAKKTMHTEEDFSRLVYDFSNCRPVLAALGDENRLHIMYQILTAATPTGLRIGDIERRSCLSRPAVSRHLKILKDAGVLKIRREGTRSFYYPDPDMNSFTTLISVLQRAVDFSKEHQR